MSERAIPGGGSGKNSAWMHRTEEGYAAGDEAQAAGSGTSIFDPTLCELAYSWFCPPGGLVLDPFAGGSVRGIVAAKMGRQYVGIELRPEQVEANEAQAVEILADDADLVSWTCADSAAELPRMAREWGDRRADLLFSCPPYADLEVYSALPGDISAMKYPDFLRLYRAIIRDACALLQQNSFAVWVVGEVRGPDGLYYGFVPDTIQAFRAAGLGFYNEAILVTAAGSLPIRVGKQFTASRKLGKTHQNVLVFVKGDAKKAVARCGPVDIDHELLDRLEAELEAEAATAGAGNAE